MPKFNVSSTLPPIEIEFEGITYAVKPLDRATWKKLRDIQRRVSEGDSEAVFEQLPLLFDNMAEDVQARLEFRQVLAIIRHVTEALYSPFKGIEAAEKKA